MVNNSTNIYMTNNHLSPLTSHLRPLKIKKTTKYADGYPYTDLGQAQKYGGKAIFGFRCLSLLKFELIHIINNNM